MKKNFIYALWGAIALIGATGLGGCAEKETEEVNPNYNPVTNEVLTNFIFNVSTSNQAMTRQSENATQASTTLASTDFRGIDNAHIMAFKQDEDGNYLKTAATATKDFDMARVLTAGTLSSEASRRVLEMSLPLNTNSMVFYGKAIAENDYNQYGHLDDTDGYKVVANLENVHFHLGKRLTAENKKKFQLTEDLLACVLTCVMNTSRGTAAVAQNDKPADDIPNYGFDISEQTASDLNWGKYAEAYAKESPKSPVDNTTSLTELEIKLARAYKDMTTIPTAELRNGSGPALIPTIKNLWSIVNSVRCATPTSLHDAVAKYMAHLISEELAKYFSNTNLPPTGASVDSVGFKDATSLIAAFKDDTYWPTTAGDKPTNVADGHFSEINTLSSTTLGQFPENFDLPQGATHLLWDNTKKSFSYAQDSIISAIGNTAFRVDDYYYPAELLYFGNSPIRVSDNEHVVSKYPANTTAWDTDADTNATDPWYGWTPNSHVKSTTRSVAMRNDINYGTALLKTTVGYKLPEGQTKLYDNNQFIQNRDYKVNENNKEITINDTSFILKGIVIGGQSPRVGWNFLPKSDTGDKQGYIYDKAIAGEGAIPASGQSAANYTLVFDNYNASPASGSGQDKVYVALELMNNTGEDFFGKDNLIPNGSNFYLIGELDPTKDGLAGLTWPTYHALPPYIYTGNTQTRVPRVFIQDYMTTANFKIGEYSLQYAYLTVPDLRSSSVTLGLSVDVKWSTGLLFDNVIVGGNTQTQVSNP